MASAKRLWLRREVHMMFGMGELAAFCTAVAWGISNQMHSAVARMAGSTSIALLRLPFMILMIGLMCLLCNADTSINLEGFLLLALSGTMGLAVGDLLLYSSILIIGPTMAVLILSLGTGITAVMGWIFMGETLPMQAVLGIAITLLGVGFVVTEHGGSVLLPGQEVPRGKTLVLGVTLASLAAICLACGYVAQRMAMQTGVQPLWATFVRASAGGVVLWTAGFVLGWAVPAVQNLVRIRPIRWLLLIASINAATGMWLASVALAIAPAGVVATLIGLQPIIVAFIGAVWYRRKPSLRVLSGAVIAFVGTALVCLR